ncbi:MAG: serine/threonine protein phosphatase [Magnetovibrio sp.]|nr:serine/threonine protein phosphatase [Magnetovibrio sp.]
MHTQYPRPPANTRIYAIGDVHGRLDLLDALLAKIADDATYGENLQIVLVMLGDYIDRGPDSRGVMQRLDDLQSGRIFKECEIHLLKGNHEESMMSFLANRDQATWLTFGGRATLNSYGVNPKQSPKAVRRDFLKALPKSHRKILRTLKFNVSLGDYGFVHAGVRPSIAWADQNPNDLLWIREEFVNSDVHHDLMIVHGHSPTSEPTERANRIGVDTKAWTSGILTCLVMQGTHRRFISTKPTSPP